MPIRLEAPQHRPGGPDGQGWNRLSLNAHMGADRAVQVTTVSSLTRSDLNPRRTA